MRRGEKGREIAEVENRKSCCKHLRGRLYVCMYGTLAHTRFSGEMRRCANTGLLGRETGGDRVRRCGAAGSLITPSRSLTLPHHFWLYWEQALLTTADSVKHS